VRRGGRRSSPRSLARERPVAGDGGGDSQDELMGHRRVNDLGVSRTAQTAALSSARRRHHHPRPGPRRHPLVRPNKTRARACANCWSCWVTRSVTLRCWSSSDSPWQRYSTCLVSGSRQTPRRPRAPLGGPRRDVGREALMHQRPPQGSLGTAGLPAVTPSPARLCRDRNQHAEAGIMVACPRSTMTSSRPCADYGPPSPRRGRQPRPGGAQVERFEEGDGEDGEPGPDDA